MPPWQRIIVLGATAPAWLLVSVLMSLVSLVLVSLALGRMSNEASRTRARDEVQAQPVTARSGDQRTSSPDILTIVPIDGSAPYSILASRLHGTGLLLGRDQKACDIVIGDQYVSSRHARIWRDEHGLHIKDLNSRNGIWREGVRVSTTTINEGDAITIGQTSFVLILRVGSGRSDNANSEFNTSRTAAKTSQ